MTDQGKETSLFAPAPNLSTSYTSPSTYGKSLPLVAEDHHDSWSLRDYARLLLRYWFLIVGFIVLGLAIAKIYTERMPRIYRSSAMINIGTYEPPVEGPTGSKLARETEKANYVNTQTQLLKSFTLADLVLQKNKGIRDFFGGAAFTGETPAKAKLPPWLLQNYLNAVSFSSLQGTTLVRIHVDTSNPEMSAEIANAHAQGFMDLVKMARRDAAEVNIAFLRARYDEASKKLEDAERRRLEHASANKINASGSEMLEKNFENKFLGLVENLNGAIDERTQSETQYRELARTRGLGAGATQEDEAIRNEQVEIARLTRELQQVHAGSPKAAELRRTISRINAGLRERGRQRLQAARSRYSQSLERTRQLQFEFEKLRKEELEMTEHRLKQETLTREVNSLKEVQASLVKRLEDSLINIENSQNTVALVDRAFAEASPISPNKTANLWRGAILGALLALILAFLLDLWDNTVRSVGELQRLLNVPVLGIVPEFSRDLAQKGSNFVRGLVRASGPDAAGTAKEGEESDEPEETAIFVDYDIPVPLISAPQSYASEAFRGILATLTSPAQIEKQRIVLITSGQQGDGKTTLAINLAICLAQMGERTLLVDADLRLPTLHRYFKLERETSGLVDVLTQPHTWRDHLMESGIDNLTLLSSGGYTARPSALLRSQAMADALNKFAEEFEFIILDSPPVGPVADPLLLARHVDGVVVVVRSGETARPVAESAITRLRQVGANIIGLVLNDTSRSDRHWRRGYNYSYDYNSNYNKPS